MRSLRVLLLLPTLAALGGCAVYTPSPYYSRPYVAPVPPPPVYARPYGYGYGYGHRGYGYRPHGYGYGGGWRRW